jgi:lipopolysaccharide/colanic/teichoic acid biosynthesis glycosyltransferase
MQLKKDFKNSLVVEDVFDSADPSLNGFDRKNYFSEMVQFCLAAVGLALVAPMFLVIGILIKLSSKGPVFYRGLRLGKNRKLFQIYKFRTLRVGSEHKIGARLLNDHDGFYTRIGRFLKRTKLDELPQLLNVLKGEMNLVGPRPIRPPFLQEFIDEIPNYNSRFAVRPGLTGLAQLKGSYFTDPKNKLRYELIYIKNRSVLFDLKLILLTFLKLLNRWFTLGFLSLAMFLFVSFVQENILPSPYIYISGIRLNILHLFIIFGGAWLLVQRIPKNRLHLYRSSINLPILTFFVFSLATSHFAIQPFASLRGSIYYAVTAFLIALLIINGETTPRFVRNAARIIALATVAVSSLGLFQLFVLNELSAAQANVGLGQGVIYLPRVSSTLGNPVILATYLVLGLPLLLCELAHAKTRQQRDFWLICATITFIGIILTQTRISLLALVITGSVFFYKRSRPLFASFLVSAALLFLLLILVAGPRYSPSSFLNEFKGTLSRTTSQLSKVSPDRFLIGVGTRNLKHLATFNEEPDREEEPDEKPLPSNMHLVLLLENGLFGWLLMMWILLAALASLYSAHKKVKDPRLQTILWAIFSSIVGFLVSMNNVDAFYKISIQVLFWGLLGIGMAIAIRFGKTKNGFIRIWRFGD